MLKLETRDDLQLIIDQGLREDLHLEFKGAPSAAATDTERNEMSKDISAMANADGGQIIYGLTEDKARKVATSFSPIDGTKITGETIQQIAQSRISPAVAGLRVKEIELAGPGEVAFVINIPRATSLAPHQAYDRKYHRRRGTITEAMADYEVREAMRRVVDPELTVDLKFRIDDIVNEYRLRIEPTIFNSSSVPALYVALTIFVDNDLGPTSDTSSPFNHDPSIVAKHPHGIEMSAVTAELGPPKYFPVFRERGSRVHQSSWVYRPNGQQLVGLGYRVTCPGFEREEYFGLVIHDRRIHRIIRY